MTPGEVLMPLWCADSWDMLFKVRSSVDDVKNLTISYKVITLLHLGAIAFGSAHFGADVGPIYLDNVNCTGSESNLTDCPHSSTVTCINSHSQDARVRCQGSIL